MATSRAAGVVTAALLGLSLGACDDATIIEDAPDRDAQTPDAGPDPGPAPRDAGQRDAGEEDAGAEAGAADAG